MENNNFKKNKYKVLKNEETSNCNSSNRKCCSL